MTVINLPGHYTSCIGKTACLVGYNSIKGEPQSKPGANLKTGPACGVRQIFTSKRRNVEL
jgi:hypothetical protein